MPAHPTQNALARRQSIDATECNWDGTELIQMEHFQDRMRQNYQAAVRVLQLIRIDRESGD